MMARRILTMLLLVGILGCPTQKPEEPSLEDPPEVSVVPPVEVKAPEPPAETEVASPRPEPEIPVARIDDLYSRVTFRRRQEGVWQEATPGLPLYPLDAVQTHPGSNARIVFASGSAMKVGEKTLVIINAARELSKSSPDRAVLRGGKVEGSTPKELWLLTSAALLRLKAGKRGHAGKAAMSVEEGKKVRVTLLQGNASMTATPIPKAGKKAKLVTMELTPKKTVTLAAPVAPKTFGIEEDVWPATEPPRRLASVAKETTPPINLFILSPADYAEVDDARIVLKGRTSAKGGKIFVNGNEVKIGEKLEFSTPVALKEGANSILIQLIRPEGESVFRRWTVIRND